MKGKITIGIDYKQVQKKIVNEIIETNHILCNKGTKIVSIKNLIKKIKYQLISNYIKDIKVSN